jgi:hypothetical protein
MRFVSSDYESRVLRLMQLNFVCRTENVKRMNSALRPHGRMLRTVYREERKIRVPTRSEVPVVQPSFRDFTQLGLLVSVS